MYKFFGVLMMIFGVLLGAYLGVWICFIGGITDIIREIKAIDTSTLNVGIGIIKILVAGSVFWLCVFFFLRKGLHLYYGLHKKMKYRRNQKISSTSDVKEKS